MKHTVLIFFSLLATASAQPKDWILYRAAVAAASGSLRLHETAEAKRWLTEAPAAHRGWEWRYLNALANQSLMERKAHDAPITGLAASSDGRLIATTSGDKLVKLWDARTGAPSGTLSGHTASTWSPAFRPGGKHLASMGSDGAVRIWSLADTSQVRVYEKLGNGMGAVAWSPDGSLLAASTWTPEPSGVKGWLHLWDFEKDVLLWKTEYGVKPVVTLSFHPSGKQFAAATWDGWIGIFGVDANGKPSAEHKFELLKGTYPAIQSVAYSTDGKTIAVGAKDNMVRLFDSRDAKLIREFAGHARWANSVAFSPQGTWLASASSDETLRLWDPATGDEMQVLHGHTASVTAVAITANSGRLVTAAADGTLRWWDAARADASRDLWKHPSDVYGFDFTADGRRAATASWGGTVKLWDVATGRELWHQPLHKQSANAVAFSPDGRRMVSGGNDGRLLLVDTADGKILATWEGIKDGRAAGIAWSRDGRTVFCPSSRPSGKLWNAESGRLLHTFTGGKGEIYSARFSNDSRWLALGWTGGEAAVFDRETGAAIVTLPPQSSGIYAVSFHPSGRVLATAGGNRTISIWALPSGGLLRKLEAHTELIYGLDFTPDGSRLASASTDQTVRIWAPESGDQMLAIPYPVQVYAVRFSPDGSRLATVPMNGTIRLLDAPQNIAP
ncbi:MAG: WD40 repeat domain-containing protein [Acidobacteria bacterium]|nr:WD40 repeat domain-containing protein [Acidobacteriota bacterium]